MHSIVTLVKKSQISGETELATMETPGKNKKLR